MVAARRSEEPLTRISVFLFDRQIAALNALNRQTLVPVSALIRQGIDLILEQHGIARPTKAQAPKRRGRTR
jgi:hypothetical protein